MQDSPEAEGRRHHLPTHNGGEMMKRAASKKTKPREITVWVYRAALQRNTISIPVTRETSDYDWSRHGFIRGTLTVPSPPRRRP